MEWREGGGWKGEGVTEFLLCKDYLAYIYILTGRKTRQMYMYTEKRQ